MEIGSFLLNWGVLAVGLILFSMGCLWMSFSKKAYKKHVLRYGRLKFGKEYETSWTRADTRVTTGVVIFWIVCITVIVGALLFFFTGLPQIGIPLWIGCTLGIAGILLLFFAHGASVSLIKREVEIALRHKKINQIYKQADRMKQEQLLRVEKVFEGLNERDKQLVIAANTGIIPPPARLVARLEIYRSIMDELHGLVTQQGVSPIDNELEAERILLEQTWWSDFVKEWKEKWSIYNEDDIWVWGYGCKKLQPYIYELGYFYQRRFVSWRIDIKSSDVVPIKLPVSHQLEKGLVLASMDNNEQAIVEFSSYIKLRPSDPIAYEVRGDAYYDTGQFDKALDDYSISIKLEPKLAEAYDKRAIVYAELGDFEKSIKDLTRAIELYPENAAYYFNRSVAHDRSGNIDKTIDDCTKAIELDKNHARAFCNRGVCYSKKGEYDKAISDYDIALELHPDFIADVYFDRGVAYQAKGEHEKALEDFTWVRKNVSDREYIEAVEQKIRGLTRGNL